MGGDLSFGSSGKEELYFFVSWMVSALEMALLTRFVSLSVKRVIWPEGLLDILIGDGRKVLAEEMGEKGEEFISIIKFDMTGVMSEY